MAALKIYSQYGVLRTIVEPSDNSSQSWAVMSDNVLNLSFTLSEFISLDVNDYTDFMGNRFWLIERFVPKQKSTLEWVYNINFYGIESLIKRFLVLNDGNPVFTLTAPAREHAALIVKAINDGMGGSDWKVGNVIATENLVIDYAGTYCDEGLKEVAGKSGVEWWMEGQTVNISRCEHGEELTLSYGKGLTALERDTADNVKFYTRLFPLGSSRNIDVEKYGHSRLQLPGGAKYVDVNVDKYGVIHHYESEAFSHIYPRRVGVISSVRSESVTDSEGKPFIIYYFKDNTLDFDPNDYEIAGLVKQITFQSGELDGRDFEVNFDSKTKEFEIITTWPYDDDTQLPGGSLIPEPGNKYILWNIRMPNEYYPLAEQEYKEAVEAYNEKHGIDISVYKCPTDYIYIQENNIDLFLGRRVRLESPEYFPGRGYRQSRITKITRKVNRPTDVDLEISDALSNSVFQKIEDSITDVENYVKTSSVSLPDIIRSGDNTHPTDNNLYSARRSRLEFIFKHVSDIVTGVLTFIKRQIFRAGVQFGESFVPGLTGTGGMIDGEGNGELESLFIRRWLEVPEIRFNRTDITIGNSWRARGAGIIESVDTENQIITLKLEEKEIGAVANGDICMGIFHSLTPSENATEDSDDSRGNFTFAGFFTVYFTIIQVLDNRRFKYQLRPTSSNWKHSFHPCEAMHFVGYGNFTNEERQTSMYETGAYRRMLWKQNTWEISAANIAMQDGDLTNLNVHGLDMTGYSSYLNNVYFTGTIKQVKPDGTPILTANDRGAWKPGDCDYYDRVSHKGGLWLCVNEDGTATEPSLDNNNWLLQVKPGKDGDDGATISNEGEWAEGKFVPYLGLIRIGNATYQCINKNGTTCSYLVLTDETVNDLTEENDYDLLGDEIDMTDFFLVAGDGAHGKDGKYVEFIYTRTPENKQPSTPKTAQEDDYIPGGWTDNPAGVTETLLYEWVSVRHKDGGIWGEFSSAAVWAKWGERGQDGDYLEYIFKRTTTNTQPDTPANSQTDGYVPAGWADDPAGVTETYVYEWVSKRKKNGGTWGNFSSPAVWAKFGKDGKDGVGISETDVMYATSTSSTVPPTTGWQTTAPTWENGRYIWSKTAVVYTNGTKTETKPVCITGGKGNSGQDGKGVKSIIEQYYLSTSPTTLSGGSWQTASPVWQNGKYIWTRSVITYTDNTTTTTNPICVTGDKGDSITHHGNWSEDKFIPYLGVVRIGDASWMCTNKNGTTCSYLILTDESGNDLTDENDYDLLSDEIDLADFVLVAEDGVDGEAGVGVKSIVEHYYLSSSPVTLANGAWTTSRPTWINGWYLWKRSVITYTDGTVVTTEAICVTGEKGDDGLQGIQGLIIRHAEWKISTQCRNDEALTSGTRYLDVALVRDITMSTGWKAYKCKVTHTATAYNAPGNTTYWEEFAANVTSLFTSLIIAKDASIDFMQGNQLLIKKEDGTVTAGLSGSQAGKKTRIWAGGTTPDNAKYRVDEEGSVHAENAYLKGVIDALSGSLGGFEIGSGRLGRGDAAGGNGMALYDRFLVFNSPDKQALIGADTINGVPILARLIDTASDMLPKWALSFDVRNGPNNHAFGGIGNGTLKGVIEGYASQIVTPATNTYLTHSIENGNRILCRFVNSGGVIALPYLPDVRSMLGVSGSTPFTLRLTYICIESSVGNGGVYGRTPDLSGLNNYNYPQRLNNNAAVQTGRLGMEVGDVDEFMLVYDGGNTEKSYRAFHLVNAH